MTHVELSPELMGHANRDETLADKLARRAHAEYLAARAYKGDRNGVDILITQQTLLEEILAELKRLNARPSESRSSCTVKTSARGFDVESKSYADDLLPDATDEAIHEYARAQRELEALKMAGWAETVAPDEKAPS